MTPIAIDKLYARLDEGLDVSVRRRISMKVVGDSGLAIEIDGERCVTAIGVWPNGCCDVDYLYVESEKGDFRHFEFSDVEEAVVIVSSEVLLALGRA